MNMEKSDLALAQTLITEELAEQSGGDFAAQAVGQILGQLIRLPDARDHDRADEALDVWVSIAATALGVVARMASDSSREGGPAC